jgi:hypothetical protein
MVMIIDLIKALKAGNELADPAKWKKGQVLTNTVGALVLAIVGVIKWKFPEINISEDVSDQITQIITAILVMVNLYITPASSKKIGVK